MKSFSAIFVRSFKQTWQLYLMILLPLSFIIVFSYIPMYGAQIAFRNYRPARGILQSPWVGLKYVERFWATPLFWRLVANTLIINFESLIFGFPMPIIFALALNYTPYPRYKKMVQTISYVPHFISTVVIVGLLKQILSPSYGVVNFILKRCGLETIDFFGRPEYFRPLFIGSGIWQGLGWNSIIYLSALSAIDPELHDAAKIDGAGILQRIWHIDIPGIAPTMTILFIMSFGGILSTGFEKVYLMQTDLTLSVSETINTYVYKIGMEGGNYSYGTAIGLFQSLVGFVMIVIVNFICNRLTETSLW